MCNIPLYDIISAILCVAHATVKHMKLYVYPWVYIYICVYVRVYRLRAEIKKISNSKSMKRSLQTQHVHANTHTCRHIHTHTLVWMFACMCEIAYIEFHFVPFSHDTENKSFTLCPGKVTVRFLITFV